jgi:hypothetical protein
LLNVRVPSLHTQSTSHHLHLFLTQCPSYCSFIR